MARRRSAIGVAVLVVATVAGAPRRARGQGAHPAVTLELDRCEDAPADEVRRLVTVELGAALVQGRGQADAGDARDTTRVTIGCSPAEPEVVSVAVRDPTTGKALQRSITLAGVPRADRARLVAIAAAELVAASWSELAHPSESLPRAVAATASPGARDLALASALRRERPAPQRPWHISVLGTARRVSDLRRVLLGGGIGAQRTGAHGLGVGLDVLVEGGEQQATLGDVDTLLVSAGPMAFARADFGPLAWESGLGARLGMARLAGQGSSDPAMPVRGQTVREPWGGPMLVLRGLVALPRRFVLSLAGEAGYVVAGVVGRVDGAPDLAVRGLWWGATLGVGLAQ
jgi:hypothetical protein